MKGYTLLKEGWKHKNIFEVFLLQGPSRTINSLSVATGIHKVTLQKWAKRFGWWDRVSTRDQKALSCIEAENDKVLKDTIMRRHQEAYQAVQEKALDFLTSKKANFAVSKSPAKDATIALDIGISGERKVLGIAGVQMKAGLVREGVAAMIELVMRE